MLITVGQVLATHVFEARGKISNNNTGAVFTSRRTFLLIRDGLPGTLTLLRSWNFVQRASHPETLAQLSGCTKIWCQGAQDDGRAPGSMIVHALAGRRTLGATGAALTMPSPPSTPHGTTSWCCRLCAPDAPLLSSACSEVKALTEKRR